MKNHLALAAAVLLAAAAWGQAAPDTISGRCERYVYMDWYDTCHAFYIDNENDPYSDHFRYTFFDGADFLVYNSDELLAKKFRTHHPLKVGGLVALVYSGPQDDGNLYPGRIRYRNPKLTNESMYLYQEDASSRHGRRLVDTVAWGDNVPRVLKLPTSAVAASSSDSSKFMFCYAYEAYFDSAVTVDSTFYIAGTYRNNTYDGMVFQYKPTIYFDVEGWNMSITCTDCMGGRRLYRIPDRRGASWVPHYRKSLTAGVFLPIRAVELEVVAADEQMGRTRGSGAYGMGMRRTIGAEAEAGFRFVMWNDSVTDNPRIIDLTRDTLFVAHFEPKSGIETDDGEALAFSLTPNPATDRITLHIGRKGSFRMELYDNSGRMLEQRRIDGPTHQLDLHAMPAGHYSIVLYEGERKAVDSFIKK